MNLAAAQRLLNIEAERSHDPDTKTACVIEQGYAYLSASNRVPDGVPALPERVTRPHKYAWIQHAEQAAVATYAREGLSTLGATAYINWFPCSTCAQSLIQAGIATIWCDRAKYEERKDDPRYGFAESLRMLVDAKIDLQWF